MSRLRRWQLNTAAPYTTEIAADARLSETDYFDDQVWRLQVGDGESPALALQSRLGGRAGLASIVPMWTLDGRTVYQAVGYVTPPVITAFAPGFLQAQGRITPQLAIRAEFWAMSSHATGARFTLANTASQPLRLRLELYGHVGAAGRERRVQLFSLSNGPVALDLTRLGNIRPMLVLEGGTADSSQSSAKVGVNLTVPAKGRITARYVVAGKTEPQAAYRDARHWLEQDWDHAFQRLTEAANATPNIETGDEELDAAIAASYRQLTQSFLRPTSSLPYASLVATRQPDRGYSRRGDGGDYPRGWNGQAPPLAYLAALAIAPVHPEWAHGLILNYLAVQRENGWIDWKPGLGGQKQGIMCLPVLARLAWGIFQYTEDEAFLRAIFPGLLRFFKRWLGDDFDADNDGVPEWQAETQTGYPWFPTFALGQPWGQHADIRTLETPDLVAYLLSEAMSLREMAYFLHDNATTQQMSGRIDSLAARLAEFWRDGSYSYRDRDSHLMTTAIEVLKDASGAEEHFPALALDPPARLVVHVSGGLEHVPQMTLHVQGADRAGAPVIESVDASAFFWSNGRGAYTSRNVFSQVDRVWCDGLIKVYKLDIHTLDTTRRDLNSLLPLWAVSVPQHHVEQLVRVLDTDAFLRPNGVTMCAADDPAFDPANASGSGGIWPYWLTLIGEGLIEHGHPELAADILGRLMRTQVQALKRDKHFSEFYHSDEPSGLGENGHVGGIVPLHLLMRILGVRIISPGRCWTGGAYALSQPVTIAQHGVRVQRRPDGTRIEFASGHVVDLPADAPLQAVNDPHYRMSHSPDSVEHATTANDLFDE